MANEIYWSCIKVYIKGNILRDPPVSKRNYKFLEMVCRDRGEDTIKDLYLNARIVRKLKLKKDTKYIIESIEHLKLIGYGNPE